MRGVTLKTPGRMDEATRLREDGRTWQEIADELGVGRSTAEAWVNDPDGTLARARKDAYRGACADCGAPTNGAAGPGNTPKRCSECARTAAGDLEARRRLSLAQRGTYTWSEAELANAIHAAAKDGGITQADYWAYTEHQRSAGVPVPTSRTFVLRFGSWRAACAAHGLTCGTTKRTYVRMPLDDLACDIAIAATIVGRPPTVAEYEWCRRARPDAGLASSATIRARFVGWPEALDAAAAIQVPEGADA